MSAEIESNSVDPYEELKKLQNLVQKLEHQNEQLLKNQFKGNKNEPNDHLMKERRSKSFGGIISDNGVGLNIKLTNRPMSFDHETNNMNPIMEEFIDVDELELSGDDSWLYTPPKGLSSEDSSLCPYKWLRKDLEDLENKELQLAKSALVDKLEELSILLPLNQIQDKMKNLSNENLSENNDILGQSRVIDTRTFTRSKKKKMSKEEESDSKDIPLVESLISNGQNGDTDGDSENYEFGYIRPELHQLSDFIDVHEKARMQEESLRQSAPMISPRGSTSLPRPKKLTNGKIISPRSTGSDTEESFANSDNSNKRNLRRPMTSTPTSNVQKFFNSTHSSPLGSQTSLNNVKVPSSLRRSLPNLAKGNSSKRSTKSINSPSSTNSSVSIRNNLSNQRQNLQLPVQQVRRDSAPTTIYRSPDEVHSYSINNSSVHNSSNLHKSSPLLTTRVQGRSGLPRPSKLPTSRPRLPVPSHQYKKNQCEETWSDGCF